MADERSELGFGRAAGAALGATRLNRRGLLRAGLLGMSGLATAALIGCGDDDDDDAAPTAAATATTAPAAGTATPAAGTATPAARTTTPTATPAARARPSSPGELDFVMNNRDPGVPPKYGGVRHTSERRRFPSVDPRANAASDVALFHGLVSSKLLEHDGSPAIGAFEDPIVGDIAESWESSPDALAFTFQLNPKAQWHNRAPADGRQVVAEDVKFTYELWMAGTLTAGRFAAVDSVEVVDEGTVRITLKGPTPELLDTFAFEHHPIVNPEVVDARGGEIGDGADGAPVYLKDIWPSSVEVADTVRNAVTSEMFDTEYADAFTGDAEWQAIETPAGMTYNWPMSTYVRNPPYFEGITAEPDPVTDIVDARVLAVLGDSVTTDHISPAGGIAPDSPAGSYLRSLQVGRKDFNSYGSRRGNHEVMMRGTFANIRLRNEMAPGTEGGWTKLMPGGEVMSIFEAAMHYAEAATPLVVFGGKEYGTGSSRDWAAKGTKLLGVRAVIVESFERIHRSNLVGMGVMPLQFTGGATRKTLGLDGSETVTITGLASDLRPRMDVACEITRADGRVVDITLLSRIDTENEIDYYRHGGILNYVLRQLAAA